MTQSGQQSNSSDHQASPNRAHEALPIHHQITRWLTAVTATSVRKEGRTAHLAHRTTAGGSDQPASDHTARRRRSAAQPPEQHNRNIWATELAATLPPLTEPQATAVGRIATQLDTRINDELAGMRRGYLILMRRMISAWLMPPAPRSIGAMTRCLPRSAILSRSRRSLWSAASQRRCHCSRLASNGICGAGLVPGLESAARSALRLAMRRSSGLIATS